VTPPDVSVSPGESLVWGADATTGFIGFGRVDGLHKTGWRDMAEWRLRL
jgi:hypothetical protein